MLSAPVHPIQVEYPSNARKRDFGDGRRGIEIDGNNAATPTGFTQRIALTMGESRAIRSSVLVKSTLVAATNGFEGIGFDLKCLIRNGESLTPTVTWTNSPFEGNDPENLFTEQYADWTLITAVVYIPHGVPVEFIDCTWGVRGSSGQVKFVSASLRNLYQDKFYTDVGAANWSSFERQLIPFGDTGHTIYAEIRYVGAYTVDVQKNEDVEVSLDMFIDDAYYLDSAVVVMPMHLMFGLKMRRRDNGYDYWGTQIARINGSDSVVRGLAIESKFSFFASSAYTQFEPIFYTLVDSARTDYSSRVFNHRGAEITIVSKDVVAGGGL